MGYDSMYTFSNSATAVGISVTAIVVTDTTFPVK